MSQTVSGDSEGVSHPPIKHFPSTVQPPVGFPVNPLPHGQNGPYCGPIMPSYPPKPPPNPNMANGFRPPMQVPANVQVGPMQYQHQHPHFNSQPHHFHQMNVVAVNNESQKPNHSMQNHCNNVQYVPGGNYVATVTVQPRDQYGHQHVQQGHFGHPSNPHFMANQHKYLMNPAMINQMNHVNYVPNVMVPGYKNPPFPPMHNPQNPNANGNLVPRSCPAVCNTVKPGESADASYEDPEAAKDASKLASESQNNSDVSSNGESSPSLLSTTSQKVANSPTNANSPVSRNSSRNSSTNNPSRPRTSSRNESDRSETAESSCSSLSTESTQEHVQNQLSHNPIYNNQSTFVSNQPFANGHMQNMGNFGSTNVNYSNFISCQQGSANSGPAKTQLVQQGFRQVNTVQQVHMQSSQVQIMHQQYQYIHGQGMQMNPRVRPNMGILPNCSIPLNTPTGGYHAGSPTVIGTHPSPSLENAREHGGSPAQDCAMMPQSPFPMQSMYPGMMDPPDQMVFPAPHLAGMPGAGFPSGVPGSTQDQVAGETKNSFPSVIVVPFGWRRINENGQIVYVSPSGTELRSSNEVTEYLTQEGTCKCGLQCPLRVGEAFCFDAKVGHRLTTPSELSSGEMTKLCNHRRKLAFAFSDHLEKQAKKEDGRKKRKRKAPPDPPMEGSSAPLAPAGNTAKQHPITVPHHQQQQQQAFLCSMQQQQQGQVTPMQPPLRHHFQAFQVGGPHQAHPPHLPPQMASPQNWSAIDGMPRMMPSGCPPVNYQQMCPPQYHGQHACCDSHGCYPGMQGPPPQCASHHINPKAFEGPDARQQFCRPPSAAAPGDPAFRGMGPSEQSCMQHSQQQSMHHFQLQQQAMLGGLNNHPAMGANVRPMHPYMGGGGGPMCRMRCAHPPNINELQQSVPGGAELASGPKKMGKEVERRRRTTGRGRKRSKPATDSPAPASEPISAPATPNCNGAGFSEASQTGATSATPTSSQEGPSFMEDPNGYLAQQTALLNNTMAGGGVGQFSPQAPGVSPRSSAPSSTHSDATMPLSPKSLTSRSTLIPGRVTNGVQSSPAVVPLPSNVPLPARVSKASSLLPACAAEHAVTTSTTTFCTATCTSVQSQSSYTTSIVSSSKMLSTNLGSAPKKFKSEASCSKVKGIDEGSTSVQITTEAPSTSMSCDSQTSSPPSSEENSQLSTDSFTHSSSLTKDLSKHSLQRSAKPISTFSGSEKLKILQNKQSNSTSNGVTKNEDALSLEAAANKPLTPGPADTSISTQSPLELVQNIVSSIPVPSSEESSPPSQGRPLCSQQGPQFISDPMQSMQHAVPQQMLGPHVFNMAGTGSMAGVVYNPGTNGSNMLRGPAPLVVHGTGSSGTIPSGGVLVSSSNNMVVVSSPFTTKGSVTTPVVCSNITGVVGVQAVPQVVPPSLGHVQQHQLQPQLQQIQPVQPVVQLVNTFAAMQGPVIIQNGGNIIQPSSGVLSNHGGVIGAAGIIPSSGPAFVTNQPLIPTATLAVESSQNSGQLSMTQVVSSASSDLSDDSVSGNRSTPVATPASTPTTPLLTPGSVNGSDTSPSSGSSGGGSSGGRRKRKRKNTSAPQNVPQQPAAAGLMPTFIMGKQIQQPMVMSNPQLSPYGNVAGAQVATVAAVGNSAGSTQAGQMLQPTTAQPAGAINVVQMVGSPAALPVHLQQPPTILLPSAAPPGLIINQLPDGTFVSTDPNTGVSYPVQIQLSGSHVVGVSPTSSQNQPAGVISSLAAPSNNAGQMVAVNSVRAPSSQANTLVGAGTKVINISPNVQSSGGGHLVNNVYDVSRNPATQASFCPAADASSSYANTQHSISHPIPLDQQSNPESIQRPFLVNNANTTVVQQKTTIVAQQTTVVAAQGGMVGTHSSVSTQTPGAFGESDVTSSDSAGNPAPEREFPTSPTHQSAEITTTRRDDDSISPPESLPSTPTQDLHHMNKGMGVPQGGVPSQTVGVTSEEPHSASLTEGPSGRVVVVWATHRGFPQWPAQLLHQAGGSVLVRWYGDHTVETIPLPSLSEFKTEAQKVTRRRSRGRDALEKAMAEAKEDLMLSHPSPPAMEEAPTLPQAGMSPTSYTYSQSIPHAVADSISEEGGICIATSSECSAGVPGQESGVVKPKRKRKLL